MIVVVAGLSLAACTSTKPPVTAPTAATGSAPPAATGGTATGGTATGGTATRGTAADRLADVEWRTFVATCPLAEQKMLVRIVYTADVTGDGVPDSLVSDTCSTESTHNANTVEVFDGASDPSKPRRLATLLSDDAQSIPWVLSLTTSGKTVTIKAGGYSARAPMSCTDLYLTYTYVFDGGTAHRTSRVTAKAAGCIPIT